MKSNVSIVIITAIIALAGSYWYFSSGTGNQPPLSTSGSPTGNSAQVQFQALVSELQPISFNTTIFSDPKFTALVNLETPVAPEPTGRLDPFAPVKGVTGL